MKLKDARDYYAFASGKTSDLVRQLAFAGIAIIWIFKSDSPGGVIKLPGELLWPLGLIVIGLVADFLQYVAATICWGAYNRYKERRVAEDVEFKAPRQINWPGLTMFALKIPPIAAAYFLLLKFMASKLL